MGLWPWPQAFLSFALIEFVLERAVLGLSLGFFASLPLASSVVYSTPTLVSTLSNI